MLSQGKWAGDKYVLFASALDNHLSPTPATSCRLEKARQLAKEGNMRTIAELALAVGFKQPDYFSRLYKKTFNCSVELSAISKGVNN